MENEQLQKPNLEVKKIYTLLVSSLNKDGTLVRGFVNIQYEVDSPNALIRLETDWKNFNNDQHLMLISYNVLSTNYEPYFNGKPLREKLNNVSQTEEEEIEDEQEESEFKRES